MASNKTVLQASNLYKSFAGGPDKPEVKVLQGMNLSIEEGTITSIIGSSGSGKSTLLHILGGLDRTDSGDVFWNEKNISALNTDELADFRNKYIGFVFQFHHLLPEFTALENVSMPALIGGASAKEANERAFGLLARFGIEQRRNHRPTQLSGGEQQRVSMARALMNNPRIILADEPTGNLDEINTNIILDLLHELRETEGVSVLLITHEQDIAKRSDKIFELKNGVLDTL
ncbi:MAG: ABC transporter ATP-binding protein [Balneolaceae bacterium]